MRFAALTASFDAARLMPSIVEPNSPCFIGVGAMAGLRAPDTRALGATVKQRVQALLQQADAASRDFSDHARLQRKNRPLNMMVIERALCGYAKYRAYDEGTKKAMYHKRPLPIRTTGFRTETGSLKCKVQRAALRHLRQTAARARKTTTGQRFCKSKFAAMGALGGKRAGFHGKFGVLKPPEKRNAISKARALAGSTSGPAKSRLCRKCGLGNRAAVHGRGGHKFVCA